MHQQGDEMADESAVFRYYVRKVITRVTSPKISEMHDSRARKARRQEKYNPDPTKHSESGG
jgi:hypothetical protein